MKSEAFVLCSPIHHQAIMRGLRFKIGIEKMHVH